MDVEQRLERFGLELPPPPAVPPGVEIPFAWVRTSGHRVFLSGHGALGPAGAPQGPFGKVPSELSVEVAQDSARLATLALLASLRAALGDLDRISAWLMVSGYINADPGFSGTTLVMNPCSELLVGLFGVEIGTHARTAIGAATLPFNLPVVIAAEIEISH
jgi:enamine deaminase RidA (YjgF/YER057c/UK114 family)